MVILDTAISLLYHADGVTYWVYRDGGSASRRVALSEGYTLADAENAVNSAIEAENEG